FGEVAGRSAALFAAKRPVSAVPSAAGADIVEQIRSLADGRKGDIAACELLDDLRQLMWRDVGPFRSAKVLARAIVRTEEMRAALPKLSLPPGRRFNPALAEWFELLGSLIAASAVAHAAAARIESRGAHQREAYPDRDRRRHRLCLHDAAARRQSHDARTASGKAAVARSRHRDAAAARATEVKSLADCHLLSEQLFYCGR